MPHLTSHKQIQNWIDANQKVGGKKRRKTCDESKHNKTQDEQFATSDKQPFVPICGIQSLNSVHVHVYAHANDMDFLFVVFHFRNIFPIWFWI